jgi:hypothetical protein
MVGASLVLALAETWATLTIMWWVKAWWIGLCGGDGDGD